MKFDIQKQRAFIDKLTNNTMISANLYPRFNALGMVMKITVIDTEEGVFDQRISGGKL